MQEQLDEQLKSGLEGKNLQGLEIYKLNEVFIELEEGKRWIVHGGIEFLFSNGHFSFGWNSELRLCQPHFGPYKDLSGTQVPMALGALEESRLAKLTSRTIKNVEAQWDFYQEMDDDFQIIEEKHYVPTELLMTLDDGTTLQLAAISYILDPKSLDISKAAYNFEGELLIAVDRKVEVMPPGDIG